MNLEKVMGTKNLDKKLETKTWEIALTFDENLEKVMGTNLRQKPGTKNWDKT